MNVSKIQSLGFLNIIKQNNTNTPNYQTNFGLRMTSPLNIDTVAFTSGKAKKVVQGIVEGTRSNKKMGDVEISTQLAKQLRAAVKNAHNENIALFEKYFEDIISEVDANNKIIKRNLVTFMQRIKGEYSVIQKVSSVAQDENISLKKINKKALLKNVTDISGMGVILEKMPAKKVSKKALNGIDNPDDLAMFETVKRLINMMRDKVINVEEIEYHRRAPEYNSNGKIVRRFGTLNRVLVQTLMDTAQEINSNCKCRTVNNPIGYSGLHIKLKNSDGTYTEFKVLARAIANIQDVENQFYKVQNGKKVAPYYEKEVGEYLAQLKPLDEYATPEEKELFEKVTRALKEYKKEVYKLGIDNPLEDITTFPVPKDPLIQQYSFNIIRDKMTRCLGNKKN